jgi:hypothetical protein
VAGRCSARPNRTIQFYEPTMVCAANGGTPTHPSLTRRSTATSYQFGRYVQLVAPSLVYVEVQLQFLGAQGESTGSVGSGGAYCISLPPEYPLKRENPGQIDRTPLSPGTGMCYLSFGSATIPDVNVEAVPVATDPWLTLKGQEDRYFSAMVPHMLDWGTWQIPSNALTVQVSHGLNYAPLASDFEVLSYTDANTTTGPTTLYVANITSGSFDVKTRNNIGVGSAQNGVWKLRAEPPFPVSGALAGALMGPNAPWDWTKATSLTPFGNFFFTLLYETQT